MIDNPPQVSLAKVGQRYYWTVYRRSIGIARIADGFADTRELAADQAAAALEEVAPGFSELLLQARLNAERCYAADQDLKALARNPGKSFAWCRAFSADSEAAGVLYKHHHGALVAPTADFT